MSGSEVGGPVYLSPIRSADGCSTGMMQEVTPEEIAKDPRVRVLVLAQLPAGCELEVRRTTSNQTALAVDDLIGAALKLDDAREFLERNGRGSENPVAEFAQLKNAVAELRRLALQDAMDIWKGFRL